MQHVPALQLDVEDEGELASTTVPPTGGAEQLEEDVEEEPILSTYCGQRPQRRVACLNQGAWQTPASGLEPWWLAGFLTGLSGCGPMRTKRRLELGTGEPIGWVDTAAFMPAAQDMMRKLLSDPGPTDAATPIVQARVAESDSTSMSGETLRFDLEGVEFEC